MYRLYEVHDVFVSVVPQVRKSMSHVVDWLGKPQSESLSEK